MHIDTRELINEHSEIDIINRDYVNLELYIYFNFIKMEMLYFIQEYIDVDENNLDKRKEIYEMLIARIKQMCVIDNKPYVYICNK